jgi:dihydrofolate synthase / folylpolyglutamate synthase
VSGRDWTPAQASEYLLSRGMFGMRPGLERITRLLEELGNPQLGLRTVHVVGTNGKSSTVRFTAALLAEHGIAAGAYVSPHLIGFEERVLLPEQDRVGLKPCAGIEFAAAVQEVAAAVALIEPDLESGDMVTQFEIVTAAALVLFRATGVEVSVVEAGLGGRHDATNVLGPGVVALTPVGLDHQQWLGDSIELIAAEKLAVVGPGDQLVVAAKVAEELNSLIDSACERAGKPHIRAGEVPTVPVEMAASGSFQLANFALAEACVVALLGACERQALADAAANVVVAGRLQRIGSEPDVWLDCAHNPHGIAAVVAEIQQIAGQRDVIAVVGVLADKDVYGIAAAMLDSVKTVIATTPENPRALDADSLASAFADAGHRDVRIEPDPRAALELAKSVADPQALVLATGSVHLVGDLVSQPGERVVTAL